MSSVIWPWGFEGDYIGDDHDDDGDDDGDDADDGDDNDGDDWATCALQSDPAPLRS